MSNIAVIGLGYVGLPLAVALAGQHDVTGFDVKAERIRELNEGYDRTGEISPEALKEAGAKWHSSPAAMKGCEIFIVTVPTPVDEKNEPDLTAILAASRSVGREIQRGAIVIYESTVWPGLTEEICASELEGASGLTCGEDFHLGYSPERINPGDSRHTLKSITKIVAADTPEIARQIAALYGSINGGNIHIAPNIRTAEAAKVIENAQRDINIAFVNEIAQICHKLDLSSADVLEAAATKWNFLEFTPGLVGGHCIGVDPYYLAHRAKQAGHQPAMILAGRQINDGMAEFVCDHIDAKLGAPGGDILVLGVTFKKNVPDLRNSQVARVIHELRAKGHSVEAHDPHADAGEARALYGIELLADIPDAGRYECIVGAVGHDRYASLDAARIAGLL
ncbi:MAG: nucleotide sugar dehydrogenase, partial [Alphaproteobacteria bacterium]|nr:nucleotide sugar dehydrogenase [Alphaproteobacteria bacterium]